MQTVVLWLTHAQLLHFLVWCIWEQTYEALTDLRSLWWVVCGVLAALNVASIENQLSAEEKQSAVTRTTEAPGSNQQFPQGQQLKK